MARKTTHVAICYDFDGTLSPGYMQNYDFIPALGMKPSNFWGEVKALSKEQEGDEILIYMGHMLSKAGSANVSITRGAFHKFGATIELFDGVETWFSRINKYAIEKNVQIDHFVISSGLREMIKGTKISKYFKKIYASGFWYDANDVARSPAIGVNYTTKTQYLFRINKGSLNVWDKEIINSYVPPSQRPIPFQNIVFIGDGETDIPCFRLVKDLGGNSIAVFKPRARSGGRKSADLLLEQGRVNFAVPANYSAGSDIEKVVFAIIDKISVESELLKLGRKS